MSRRPKHHQVTSGPQKTYVDALTSSVLGRVDAPEAELRAGPAVPGHVEGEDREGELVVAGQRLEEGGRTGLGAARYHGSVARA